MISFQSLTDRLPIEQVYTSFLALERERQILAVVGGLLLLVLVTAIPLSCASKHLGRLESDYRNGQKNMADLLERVETHQALKKQVSDLEATLKRNSTSLQTALSNLATELGVGDKVSYKKAREGSPVGEEYREDVSQVTVSQVSLSLMVRYLSAIESSQKLPMRLSRLEVKANRKDRNKLDASFLVSTLVPKGGS